MASAENQVYPHANVRRVLSCVGATLSVCGSSLIISHVFIGKRFQKNPLHRLVLGLSIMDTLFSAYLIVAHSFVYPIYAPSTMCSMDAFMHSVAHASPFYNSAISFYYVAIVRWNVKERTFAKRYELWCHLLAILGVLIPAAAGLFLEIYNPRDSRNGCYIQAYPLHCEDNADIECTRGGKTIIALFPLFSTILPFLFVILSMAINNYLLYRHVRTLEQRNLRFVFGSNPKRKAATASRSRKIATQSLLYVASFWLHFGAGLVVFIMTQAGATSGKDVSTIMLVFLLLSSTFYPAQGFFNALVYIRPHYMQWRTTAGESRGTALWKAIFSVDPPPRRTVPKLPGVLKYEDGDEHGEEMKVGDDAEEGSIQDTETQDNSDNRVGEQNVYHHR